MRLTTIDGILLLEQVYCTASTNATDDTIEFDKCLEQAELKLRSERVKKIWFWILFSLGVFFITLIGKYFFCSL